MKGCVFHIWGLLWVSWGMFQRSIWAFFQENDMSQLIIAHVGCDILQISQIVVEREDLKSSIKNTALTATAISEMRPVSTL